MSLDPGIPDELSSESINSIARKLKHYWSNIYTISPVELATFVKIKSNFLRQGIVLEESVLNSSVSNITSWLERKLRSTNFLSSNNIGDFPSNDNLDGLLNVDVDCIESERQEIRKQLFNEDIKVRIQQSVKSFSIQCNKKMTVWDIRIPASWNVNVEQSFLLSLYDKTFHKKEEKPKADVTKLEPDSVDEELNEKDLTDSISKFTGSIIQKYNDFSLIRAELDSFLADKKNLTTLELGEDIFGDDLPLSSIIILKVFSDKIIAGKIDKTDVFRKIGVRRKRLLKRLEDFLSAKRSSKK